MQNESKGRLDGWRGRVCGRRVIFLERKDSGATKMSRNLLRLALSLWLTLVSQLRFVTFAVGHDGASGHSIHLGRCGWQMVCPKPIMAREISLQCSRGTHCSNSSRVCSGVLQSDVQLEKKEQQRQHLQYEWRGEMPYPRRLEMRCTRVSTMIPST